MTNKKSTTKVDVLLPYWGDFSLLKKSVDSVLSQTEENWNLLIIDDCYPSKEAEEYYSNFPDKRVTYIRHKKNMGLVKNYNFAISKSTSNYCVILGSDDVMLPNYLERALNKIGECDYYQPNVEVIDENDKVYFPLVDRTKKFIRPNKEGIHTGDKLAASLCHGNWTYFPSILWRTETIKKYRFDEDKPNTQDVVVQLNILSEGGSVFIDNDKTFQYRRSANSFSSKAKGGTRFDEEAKVFKEYATKFNKMGWKRAERAARLHLTVRLHKAMP